MAKEPINKDVADCLYVGIMTRYRFVQYGLFAKRTFEIAGELVNKGV
jgi:hypothetical protein